jgi:chaperonin GroEL (HSP60 family)
MQATPTEQLTIELTHAEAELLTEAARKLNCSAGDIIRTATRNLLCTPMNRREAAAFAGVSLRTLDNWLKQGMSHVKIRRIIRITRHDIQQWLIRHKYSSQSIPGVPAGSRGRKPRALSPR